jgi:outer membrane immunogenic protein
MKAPVAVALFSWTGFYVGGTVGAAWTHSDVSLSAANDPSSALVWNAADIPGLNALGSPNLRAANAIFGAKAGYNQQWGVWVLGLEGDISYLRFNQTSNTSGNPFLTFAPGSAAFTENVSTNWVATVRPRIGYAFDRALAYATGGFAFGRVGFSNSYIGFSPHGFGNETLNLSASQTKTGWSLGGGVDYALTNNWILSLEYLHVDLGTLSTSGTVRQASNAAVTSTMNFSVKLQSDIVRAGIAYKF